MKGRETLSINKITFTKCNNQQNRNELNKQIKISKLKENSKEPLWIKPIKERVNTVNVELVKVNDSMCINPKDNDGDNTN